MAEKPPSLGQVVNGYRYAGGDPSAETSWVSVTDRQPTGVPASQMETSGLGTAYGAGKALLGAVPSVLPAVAAGVAGAAAPEIAPFTAPAAYAATEGLINPREIQQHPIEEGIAAGTMAIPGPAQAVKYAFPRFALEHPGMIKAGGALLGGALGGLAGEEAGSKAGGQYGALGGGGVGTLGGAFLGYRFAKEELPEIGKQLVSDTLAGVRPESELPEMLRNRYLAEKTRRVNLEYLNALQSGETPATRAMPTSLGRSVEHTMEERAKKVPILPRVVILPEEEAAQAQAARVAEMRAQILHRDARVGGMAHAAQSHETVFEPSKFGESIKISKGSRLIPVVKPKP